ncbi:hypothetical protein EV426DRAFT_627484 [Tirmania nivea]|nr:hypothetical protein EV426DRAFT_627484 [Tirmania nivea]
MTIVESAARVQKLYEEDEDEFGFGMIVDLARDTSLRQTQDTSLHQTQHTGICQARNTTDTPRDTTDLRQAQDTTNLRQTRDTADFRQATGKQAYQGNTYPVQAYPARGNPDTLYLSPAISPANRRKTHQQQERPFVQADKWVEDTMVTVPIHQLCTESIEFREKLFKTLTPRRQEPEPEPESENEQEVPQLARARRNLPRREVQNEENSDSDEMEDTIRVQPPRREWLPAFLVGAYFGTTFNQDVLLDCGATCSLVSPELSAKILRENAGKSTVEGWVKIMVDLG